MTEHVGFTVLVVLRSIEYGLLTPADGFIKLPFLHVLSLFKTG